MTGSQNKMQRALGPAWAWWAAVRTWSLLVTPLPAELDAGRLKRSSRPAERPLARSFPRGEFDVAKHPESISTTCFLKWRSISVPPLPLESPSSSLEDALFSVRHQSTSSQASAAEGRRLSDRPWPCRSFAVFPTPGPLRSPFILFSRCVVSAP